MTDVDSRSIEPQTDLGRLLITAMENQRKSQASLSKQTGVTREVIRSWLTGHYRTSDRLVVPDPATLLRVTRALDIPDDDVRSALAELYLTRVRTEEQVLTDLDHDLAAAERALQQEPE